MNKRQLISTLMINESGDVPQGARPAIHRSLHNNRLQVSLLKRISLWERALGP